MKTSNFVYALKCLDVLSGPHGERQVWTPVQLEHMLGHEIIGSLVYAERCPVLVAPHSANVARKSAQRCANKDIRAGANHLFDHAEVVLIQGVEIVRL